MSAGVHFARVAWHAVLGSAGGLLRAWRQQVGWTQAYLAELVHASVTAVSSWETGARGIPLEMLELLDAEFGAGGCLVDLARAIGTRRADAGERLGGGEPGPRRYWGHVFDFAPGPVWAWLRPAGGLRLTGYGYSRLLAQHVDQVTGPDGVFMTAQYWDTQLPMQVMLAEPGWADFGRGTPPDWLGVPRKQSAGLRDVMLVNPSGPLVRYLGAEFRRRDRGAPATLWSRLQPLVEPEVWDRFAAAVRGGAGKPARATLYLTGEPRPPQTSAERRALHRRLRQARGMSQADAALAVTRLLAAGSAAGAAIRPVTEYQIKNYEAGRVSRLRYLPALLDMAYAAFGWSCYEPVPVRRLRPGLFEAAIPDFWMGPVTVTAEPVVALPEGGAIRFAWQQWQLDRDLPGMRAAFSFCRVRGYPPLRVQVPPGWTVIVHAGQHADALDASADWVPADDEAAAKVFDLYTTGWLRQIGRTKADLDRALARSR
jgi:transcriptional regulator with XRE-family HTH domain